MDAMLVVDMQVGLLNGDPKHDLHGVIDRINRLAARVREQSGMVIFIQHCGGKGDDFEPETPGWAFLPELVRDPADVVVQKQMNDPFAGGRTAGAARQDRARSGAGDRLGDRPLRRCDRPLRRVEPSPGRGGDRRPHAERPPSPRRAQRYPSPSLGLEQSDQPKAGQARADRRIADLTGAMTQPVR